MKTAPRWLWFAAGVVVALLAGAVPSVDVRVGRLEGQVRDLQRRLAVLEARAAEAAKAPAQASATRSSRSRGAATAAAAPQAAPVVPLDAYRTSPRPITSGNPRLIDNWRQLRVGMSVHDVQWLLGEPTRVSVINSFEYWYFNDASNGYVRLDGASRRLASWSEPK